MRSLNYLILLLLISPLAQAQVMKCTDAKGNVTFSDGGCRSTHKTATVIMNDSQNSSSAVNRYRTRSDYSSNYSNNHVQQEYDRYNARESWDNYKTNYEKARKFAADRQHAKEYEDEIRLANEARMRNMDRNSSYNPYSSNAYSSTGYSLNPYTSNRRACHFSGSQMVCN